MPPYEDLRLLRFAEPVPRRQIAMYWRLTSVHGDLLPKVADVIRQEAATRTGASAVR